MCTSKTLPTTTSPTSPEYLARKGCTHINLSTFSTVPDSEEKSRPPLEYTPWPLILTSGVLHERIVLRQRLSRSNHPHRGRKFVRLRRGSACRMDPSDILGLLTLSQHIRQDPLNAGEAAGGYSRLLEAIGVACKLIASLIRRAGMLHL